MTLELSASRTALLCMDFQRDIVADSPLAPTDPEARRRFDDVIARTAELLATARAAAATVIHVRIAFSPGYPEASPHVAMARFMRSHGALIDGSPGADFDPRVAPVDGEPVVTKRGVSAFVGTELGRTLRVRGIDTLVATGLVTHYVVEGTARHASDLGYRVVVASDCCTSGGLDRHDMALRNLAPLCEIHEAGSLSWVANP